MNRNDFKQLSLIRLKEARVLLKNKDYDGAYYLCGYVVECGLKACIAKKTKRHDFPPERKTIDEIYTHEPNKLVKAAGLSIELEKTMGKNKTFAKYWGTVKDWKEVSRYERHTEMDARDLFSAVSSKKHGVLQWLKKYW